MIVIDASVVVAWFVDEPASPHARAMMTESRSMVVLDLTFAEVANALWRLSRLGHVTEAQILHALRELDTMFPDPISTAAVIADAVRISMSIAHPIYDAFYIAAAIDNDATLITNDRRLLTKVAGTPWAARVRPLVDAPGP